ncbi:hypothetical protein CW711_05065 [Candidatus Bathyarchaeota archaeon]|nr:MAG: hypothetical protein CW711_05065 [Candidatus Bathyarchaeota archaeon]
MRDVSQGRLLFALSVITMIVYFWAVFLAPKDIVDPILGKTISEWALISSDLSLPLPFRGSLDRVDYGYDSPTPPG